MQITDSLALDAELNNVKNAKDILTIMVILV
jgi:hypothetical protein